jgi:hypothetical protein
MIQDNSVTEWDQREIAERYGELPGADNHGSEIFTMCLAYPQIVLPKELVEIILFRSACGGTDCIQVDYTMEADGVTVADRDARLQHINDCDVPRFFRRYGDHETYTAGTLGDFFGY